MTTNGTLTQLMLPDLVIPCPYSFRINPHQDEQTKASEKWLFAVAGFTKEQEDFFTRQKFGEVTACYYPDADAHSLRLCIDLMNLTFALDDWMEESEGVNALADCTIETIRDPTNFKIDNKFGVLAKCWFGRLIQTSVHPSVVERIVQGLVSTYKAQAQEEEDRVNGYIPELRTYIAGRREAG